MMQPTETFQVEFWSELQDDKRETASARPSASLDVMNNTSQRNTTH